MRAGMAMSDRAFRGLARDQPAALVDLFEVVAPDLLPRGARVTPEKVTDPHIEPAPSALEADWVARVEPGELLHVECQGYRDPRFPSRLFRYHLGLVLRYPERRVRTAALWLTSAPAPQRRDRIEIGDLVLRVRNVVLARMAAAPLLDHAAACFAAGADPGGWSVSELCDRTARALAERRATFWERHMAVVAAASRGRYKEMVAAMERAKLEPVIVEDLVRFGMEQGFEEGQEKGREQGREQGRQEGRQEGREQGRLEMARQALLDVLDALGVALDGEQRARVEAEPSPDRLREWLRRAPAVGSAAELLGA